MITIVCHRYWNDLQEVHKSTKPPPLRVSMTNFNQSLAACRFLLFSTSTSVCSWKPAVLSLSVTVHPSDPAVHGREPPGVLRTGPLLAAPVPWWNTPEHGVNSAFGLFGDPGSSESLRMNSSDLNSDLHRNHLPGTSEKGSSEKKRTSEKPEPGIISRGFFPLPTFSSGFGDDPFSFRPQITWISWTGTSNKR